MRIGILTFTIVLLCFSFSIAQQSRQRVFYHPERSNCMVFEGRVGLQRNLDKGVSPLIYSGLTYGGGLGYESKDDFRIWNVYGAFEQGYQYSPSEMDNGGYKSINIDVKARYMLNLDASGVLPFDAYAGLAANQINRLRVNYEMFNAALGYDIVTGFGAGARIEKEFIIEGFDINLFRWTYKYLSHNASFDWQLDFPLGFVFLRPTYVTIENFVDGREDPYDIKRSEAAFIGRLVYIDSNIGFQYELRNSNKVRLGYLWNYYKIDQGYNPVQGASHLLNLQFWFSFNHKG